MMDNHGMKPLFTWRSAVCDSGLSAVTRHIALTLSLHMNERGGSAFPSIATLADETGYDARTVQRHLRTMVESGWLTARISQGGRARTNTYSSSYPQGWSEPLKGGETLAHDPERVAPQSPEDVLGRSKGEGWHGARVSTNPAVPTPFADREPPPPRDSEAAEKVRRIRQERAS